eukprot:gene2609-5101_t
MSAGKKHRMGLSAELIDILQKCESANDLCIDNGAFTSTESASCCSEGESSLRMVSAEIPPDICRQTPPPFSSQFAMDAYCTKENMSFHVHNDPSPTSPNRHREIEKKYSFPAMEPVPMPPVNRSIKRRTVEPATFVSSLPEDIKAKLRNSVQTISYPSFPSTSSDSFVSSSNNNISINDSSTQEQQNSTPADMPFITLPLFPTSNYSTSNSTSIMNENYTNERPLPVTPPVPRYSSPLLHRPRTNSTPEQIQSQLQAQPRSPVHNLTSYSPSPLRGCSNQSFRSANLQSPFCPRSPFTPKITALALLSLSSESNTSTLPHDEVQHNLFTSTYSNEDNNSASLLIKKYEKGTFLKYFENNTVCIARTVDDTYVSDILIKIQKFGDVLSDGTIFILLKTITLISMDTIINPLDLIEISNKTTISTYMDDLNLNNEIGGYICNSFYGEDLNEPVEVYSLSTDRICL